MLYILSVWLGWNFWIHFPVGPRLDVLRQKFLSSLAHDCEAADPPLPRLSCFDMLMDAEDQWVPCAPCSLLQLLLLTVDGEDKEQSCPKATPRQTCGNRPTEMEAAWRPLQEPSLCSPILAVEPGSFSGWLVGDHFHLLDQLLQLLPQLCNIWHYSRTVIP